MSAAFVDDVAHAVLNQLLGSGATLLPGSLYVGLLLSEPPNSNGSIVFEPVGNAYARQLVTNNGANWPAAVNRKKTCAIDITFPPATGSGWGAIAYAGLFDALTGGNLKIYGALTTIRTVNYGDQLRFLAASSPLVVSLPVV